MTRRDIELSLWYNYPDHGPALSDHPELGDSPNAQDVMRALGITYRKAHPRPITDSWLFHDCQNIPETLPKFVTVYTVEDGKFCYCEAKP